MYRFSILGKMNDEIVTMPIINVLVSKGKPE